MKGKKHVQDARFYVGQTFVNKLEIKELVALHAIQTKRKLSFKKDECVRVRVICEGSVPQYKKGEKGDGSLKRTNPRKKKGCY